MTAPEPDVTPTEERPYLASLTLPPLVLDVYTSPALANEPYVTEHLLPGVERLWPCFLEAAQAEGILDVLGLKSDGQVWEIDLNVVDNADIRQINREYRDKDSATDVLSFTLLADSGSAALWTGLPVVQFGSLFVSLEWARAEASSAGDDTSPQLLRYVLERFVHGLLHLMGVHHDTMSEYERVVSIQKRVLDAAATSRGH